MDARRLELYELLKPKLDEEAARQLVLALPPDPETLARQEDLRRLGEDLRAEFRAEIRALGDRMDARFAQQEATFTRRMVTILGAWTILVGSTVGWVALAFPK